MKNTIFIFFNISIIKIQFQLLKQVHLTDITVKGRILIDFQLKTIECMLN